MADGAQQDGVEVRQFVDQAGGQDLAGAEIAIAAEVEVLQFVANAFQGGDGLEDLDASAATSGPVPSPPTTATRRMSLLLTLNSPAKTRLDQVPPLTTLRKVTIVAPRRAALRQAAPGGTQGPRWGSPRSTHPTGAPAAQG